MREVIEHRMSQARGPVVLMGLAWDILRGMGVAHWRMLRMDPQLALANGGVLSWHTQARAAGTVLAGGWLTLLSVFVPVFVLGICLWNPHWGSVLPMLLLAISVVAGKKSADFVGERVKAYDPEPQGKNNLFNKQTVGLNIGLVAFSTIVVVMLVLGLRKIIEMGSAIDQTTLTLRYMFAPDDGKGFEYLILGTLAMMFSMFSAQTLKNLGAGKPKLTHHRAVKLTVNGTIVAVGLVCLGFSGWIVFMGGTVSALPFFMAGIVNISAPLVAKSNIRSMEVKYIQLCFVAPLALLLGSLVGTLLHIMSEEAQDKSARIGKLVLEFTQHRSEEKLWLGIEQVSGEMAYRSSNLLGTKIAAGMTQGQWCVLYHKGLPDSDRRVCSVLENKNAWVGNYAQANQAKEQWLYLPVVADILGPGNSGRAGK